MHMQTIVIIGGGTIGTAFVETLHQLHPGATIHWFSRTPKHVASENVIHTVVNYDDEQSIDHAAAVATQQGQLDLVLVTTGILHVEDIMPEKSLKELSANKFSHIYHVNTVLPALFAKHFVPHLSKERKSVFGVLSARVGSISDNQLGGWYAYRASKAALNMIIKNVAIEVRRRNKEARIVGLHPGTVNSELSKPFQKNVPENKLFSPTQSATYMLNVIDNLQAEDSGKCFAWDGAEIPA